jgi:putative transposase
MKQSGQLPSNEWKGEFFNKYEAIKGVRELKQHYPFLKEADSIALQKSLENLNDSYTRYYKKQNDKPRFKSKKNAVQSYTTKQTNGNITVSGNHIKLPKLGLVRFSKSRAVEGRILNATVRLHPSGKYFVSLLAETEVQALPRTHSACGIDVGLKDFAVVSDGTVHQNPKWFKRLEQKLANAQRRLARRTKGSSNWHKQRIQIARIHERIANARNDYLHKISTEIVKNHDIIGVEDLAVKNLLKNTNLAKAISEVSWSQFRTMLAYKASWYGKQVIAVARNFASSQICSCCGTKNKDLKNLAVREWDCPTCGSHHQRDLNASINLRNEAIRLLTVGTTGIA